MWGRSPVITVKERPLAASGAGCRPGRGRVARAIPKDLLDLHRCDSGGRLVSDQDPRIARILQHVLNWLRGRHQGP